jgi:hypothetical protein
MNKKVVWLLLAISVLLVAAEPLPDSDDFIWGVVIGEKQSFATNVEFFPGVQYAWGYMDPDFEINSSVDVLPWIAASTFSKPMIRACPAIALYQYSPNMYAGPGHPFVSQDANGRWTANNPMMAVADLMEFEQRCHETTIVWGSVSPHDYCKYSDWARSSGQFCGTGAEYGDVIFKLYEAAAGREFPHIWGVILSQNTDQDDYPIRQQLDDYLAVAVEHDIEDVWVTYFNIKGDVDQGYKADPDEWRENLDYARQRVDAIFVAHIRAPKWLRNITNDCFRSLRCNTSETDYSGYSVSGEVFFDLLANQ